VCMFGSDHSKFPFLTYHIFYMDSFKHNSHHTLCLGIVIEVSNLQFNHRLEIPLHFLQHHACIDMHTYSISNPIPRRQIHDTLVPNPLPWKFWKKEGFHVNSLQLEGHEKIPMQYYVNIGLTSHHPTTQLHKIQNNLSSVPNLR